VTGCLLIAFSDQRTATLSTPGRVRGLKGLVRSEDEWTSFAIGQIEAEIRSLVAGGNGNIWASTGSGDILRVVLSPDGRQVETITQYDEKDGLSGGYKALTSIGERAAVVSEEGFYRAQNSDQPPESWRFAREQRRAPRGQRHRHPQGSVRDE
jgi:hypothetical protein